MSPDSFECVVKAAEILAGETGTAREQLAGAGRRFWRAIIDVDCWPRDLAK